MAPKYFQSESPHNLGHKSKAEYLKEAIRVNQAGEYGAKQIYAGQMAILGNKGKLGETIQHMAEQEEQHLRYFNQQILKRQVRPTLLQPFWKIAGFALGASTAMLGKRAAMACTVAVEEVIDGHYQEQLDYLETHAPEEKELIDAIKQFQAEELEHRDIGLENEAEQTPGYQMLSQLIKTGSKCAIWLAKRI